MERKYTKKRRKITELLYKKVFNNALKDIYEILKDKNSYSKRIINEFILPNLKA